MKKLLAALVLAAAVVTVVALLAGCGNATVAEVNGKKITRDELSKYAAGQRLTEMINGIIMVDLAKKKGLAITDEAFDKRLDYLNKTRDIEYQINQSGLTLEEIKPQLKAQMALAALQADKMKDSLKDEALQGFYDSQKAQLFDAPERTRVSAMVFETKEKADKAAKLLKDGKDWEQVSKELDSPTMRDMVPKTGPVPQELVKAAFDTPVGKASAPISLKQRTGTTNWLILKPEGKVPAVKLSYEDVKEQLKLDIAGIPQMQDPKGSAAVQEEIQKARRSAKITISDESLKQVAESFKR